MPDDITSSCLNMSTHREKQVSPIRARPDFSSANEVENGVATFRAPKAEEIKAKVVDYVDTPKYHDTELLSDTTSQRLMRASYDRFNAGVSLGSA